MGAPSCKQKGTGDAGMGGSKNGRQGISGDRRKIGGKGSQEMGGKMGGNGEREKRREEKWKRKLFRGVIENGTRVWGGGGL